MFHSASCHPTLLANCRESGPENLQLKNSLGAVFPCSAAKNGIHSLRKTAAEPRRAEFRFFHVMPLVELHRQEERLRSFGMCLKSPAQQYELQARGKDEQRYSWLFTACAIRTSSYD